MGVAMPPNAMEAAFLAQLDENVPAREMLAEAGLPHRRIEEWKWSDLRAVVGKLPAEPGVLTFVAARESDTVAKQGQESALCMPLLASALSKELHIYTLKNGETLELNVDASAGFTHQQLLVLVPAGIKAQLLEHYTVQSCAFANLTLTIVVETDARLDRVVKQDAAPEGALVLTSLIKLAPKARMAQTTLGFGARLARIETHVSHAGEGAQIRLDGACVVGAGLHLDQTSVVCHEGAHGQTDELFKTVVARDGKGVFQGKVYVSGGAQKTDARMQHRGLLLDDKAEIDAKPELEIYADDVVCTHGNALGAIDDEALFYMRQRGLPEAAARTLLIESFLAEPLERIEDEKVREHLLALLRTRLGVVT